MDKQDHSDRHSNRFSNTHGPRCAVVVLDRPWSVCHRKRAQSRFVSSFGRLGAAARTTDTRPCQALWAHACDDRCAKPNSTPYALGIKIISGAFAFELILCTHPLHSSFQSCKDSQRFHELWEEYRSNMTDGLHISQESQRLIRRKAHKTHHHSNACHETTASSENPTIF